MLNVSRQVMSNYDEKMDELYEIVNTFTDTFLFEEFREKVNSNSNLETDWKLFHDVERVVKICRMESLEAKLNIIS